MATTQVGSSSKNSIIAPPPQLTRRNHIFLRVDASFLARSSPTRVTDAKSSLNLPTDGFPSDGASRQQTILALSMPSGRRPPHQIKCLAPGRQCRERAASGHSGREGGSRGGAHFSSPRLPAPMGCQPTIRKLARCSARFWARLQAPWFAAVVHHCYLMSGRPRQYPRQNALGWRRSPPFIEGLALLQLRTGPLLQFLLHPILAIKASEVSVKSTLRGNAFRLWR
jgi:hypothetical protein